MAIAILGAGNAGRAMAAYLSLRGHRVHLYNRWADELADIVDGRIFLSGAMEGTARIELITTDIDAALADTQLVMMVVPSFGHSYLAEQMAPHLRPGQLVVVHPGIVGGALAVQSALLRQKPGLDITVAESVTSLFAARNRGEGHVHLRRVLDAVPVGVLPVCQTEEALRLLADPFEGKFTAASSVLETSLNSINPIYHCPGMLCNLGRVDMSEQRYFGEVITPSSARLIEAIDQERLALAARLEVPARSFSGWHEVFFGVPGHNDVIAQTRTAYLAGGGSPLPTRSDHRFITEDVPFGLVPWVHLGRLVGTTLPVTHAVVDVLSTAVDRDFWAEGRGLQDMGLASITSSRALRERCGLD